MLRFSRMLLRVLNVGNWLAAAAFAVLIVLLAMRPELIVARFGPHAAGGGHLAQTMLALGIGVTVATHVIFIRVIAVIDTVAARHPFAAAKVFATGAEMQDELAATV